MADKKSIKLFMCRPCAEELKTQGKVKIGASSTSKETCVNCGRRRFVYNVEMLEQEKLLILPIKKEWFDKIVRGEKKEEYREIKPYWTKRFKTEECEVIFKNGYMTNSPTCRCKIRIHKGYGKVEWGAEPDKEYYVLDILKVIEVKMKG